MAQPAREDLKVLRDWCAYVRGMVEWRLSLANERLGDLRGACPYPRFDADGNRIGTMTNPVTLPYHAGRVEVQDRS